MWMGEFIMSYMMVKKEFMVIGLKGSGEFVNFGIDVPLLAKKLISRSHEIPHSTEIEIALYEPKKDLEHKIGDYYVGLLVSEKINEVPQGLELIEIKKNYITTRGNINNLGELHLDLLNWGEAQGYHRDLDSLIVETYHPIVDGGEEVQIYLPIKE